MGGILTKKIEKALRKGPLRKVRTKKRISQEGNPKHNYNGGSCNQRRRKAQLLQTNNPAKMKVSKSKETGAKDSEIEISGENESRSEVVRKNMQSKSRCYAAISFKNVRNRIMSFCYVKDLQRLEVVCKLTNNSKEVHGIVKTIREGLAGSNPDEELASIRAALTHLCYMTENLKHQDDIHRRKLYVQSNACEAVAKLLRLPQCRQNAGLLEEACWAVHHLARDREGMKRITKLKVHQIICNILDNLDFLAQTGVQSRALGAVINMTIEVTSVELVVKEGVCKKVVSMLQRPGFADIYEIQWHGLRCIHNLAWFKEARQPLVDAGAVETVVKTLKNPVVVNEHETLSIALSSLRNLCTHDAAPDEIISLGGHKTLLELCLAKKNKDAAAVHEQGLILIYALGQRQTTWSSVDAIGDFIRGGVCQLILNDLTNEEFKTNSNIQGPVLGNILQLLLQRQAFSTLMQLDILSHVKRVLKTFDKDEDLSSMGNRIIDIAEELNASIKSEEVVQTETVI